MENVLKLVIQRVASIYAVNLEQSLRIVRTLKGKRNPIISLKFRSFDIYIDMTFLNSSGVYQDDAIFYFLTQYLPKIGLADIELYCEDTSDSVGSSPQFRQSRVEHNFKTLDSSWFLINIVKVRHVD